MPVNWGLLNPAVAGQAQMVNPFAAFEAGRAQADERAQRERQGELQGLQIQGARADMAAKGNSAQALQMLAQASAAEAAGDTATAQRLRAEATARSPETALDFETKNSQNRFRLEQANAQRQAALTAEQNRNRPFVIQALETVAKGGNLDAAKSIFEANGIPWKPEVHDRFFSQPPEQLAGTIRTLKDQQATPGARDRSAIARDEAAAQADKDRARAALIAANKSPASGGGGGGVRYSWQTIDGRRKLMNNATGQTVVDAGRAGSDNQMGSIERRMWESMSSSANSVVAELSNVMQMPVGSNTGIFGVGSEPGESVMGSTIDTLRNSLSPEEVQIYSATIANLARGLAYLETGGRSINNTTVNELKRALSVREEDTGFTILVRLASVPQLVEKYLEPKLSNPSGTPEQKELLRSIIRDAHEAVPWSVEDVIKFKNEGGKARFNESETFRVAGQRTLGRSASAAPGLLDPNANPFGGPNIFAPTAPTGPAAPAAPRAAPASNGEWRVIRRVR